MQTDGVVVIMGQVALYKSGHTIRRRASTDMQH